MCGLVMLVPVKCQPLTFCSKKCAELWIAWESRDGKDNKDKH